MASAGTINSITYYLSIYGGFFLIITGLIGNIINILVFTLLKIFQKNQSAFYLIVGSIVDCYLLIFSTATTVTTTASFGYDVTQTSNVWCKIRAYLTQFGGTVLPTTICFSAIDQYLSTSYHNQLRQMSTFKLAQRLTGILIILAALYSISFPIFEEVHPISGCAIYNSAYNYYYSFVHLCIVLGILPIVVSSFFSFLAYQNVRRITRRQMPIVRRRLDRQLTAMILVRVALFVITILPFVIYRTYELNNSVDQNDAYAVAVDQLIKMVVTRFYNINYAVVDLFVFFY